MNQSYNKITIGFVIQEFTRDGKPLRQEFIAEDGCTYEDLQGEELDGCPARHEESFPLEMADAKPSAVDTVITGGNINGIDDQYFIVK